MNMAKRERSVNWEKEEKQLFREIIKSFMHIIENKDITTNTNKEKLNAWTEITHQFNAANKRPRDKKQLVNQWKLMKLNSKKEVSNYRREASQTGGGPKPSSPCPETMEIIEMIPQEFEVDYNGFDCDGKQEMYMKANGNIANEIISEETLFEPGPSSSQSMPVVMAMENKATPSTSKPLPPLREFMTPSLSTRKRSGKKRILAESSFNFAEASFQDMKKYRELENERQQKEHELRLKNMAELQDQVMINLRLQEKILNKFLEKGV